MDTKNELYKRLRQISASTEATQKTIKDLIEINHDVAATGNIRGPIPPKTEELIAALERQARQTVQACEELRVAHQHTEE
ncbi:MAG: hypothetical protein ABI143_10680 [Caldimonas sp.]